MVPALFFYQLVLVALVWLCLMLHWTWPSDPPLRARHPRSPQAHGPSASMSPPPLRASPPSRLATPASTPATSAQRHPAPHHRASCPRGGAAARWTPPPISAPTPTVRIAVGWAGGTSAPMAIPMGA